MIGPSPGNELPGYYLGAPLGLIRLQRMPYFNAYAPAPLYKRGVFGAEVF